MRSQRRTRPALRFALASSLALAALALAALPQTSAQQKQDQPSGATKSAAPAAADPAAAKGSAEQPLLLLQGQTTAAPGQAAATVVSVPAAAAAIAEDERHIVNADLVTVNVTLTDSYGRYVTGLGKEAFSIFDNKEEQQITHFSDDDAPVSMGVVFDVSGSMGKEKLGRARDALRHFIDTSHGGDEYFLIGFNSRAQLLMDRTRDSDAMLSKLTFVEAKGNTALYDACYLGLERVTRGTHQKRALLIISDGQDNASRYSFGELRRLLKETDVLIYAVGIVERNNPGTLDMGGQALLDELASVSGGRAFFPETAAEMNEIFERIAIELRHQYSIGYKPSNFMNDGKWRRIKVKVNPPRGLPRLFVRAKEGYYATTNPR
ncbi:MAG TPA: VWA domain-containing protein [Pyrinomonadaceae bacterium]|nr:VWA domain-containing protein [Pyrinomonadaceae bacterium]